MPEIKIQVTEAEAEALTKYAKATGQQENAVVRQLLAELPDRMPRPPVQRLPIRLTQTPTKCGVHPVAGVKLSIGW